LANFFRSFSLIGSTPREQRREKPQAANTTLRPFPPEGCSKQNSAAAHTYPMLLRGFPSPLSRALIMIESDQTEERLARVEQMLARCQREAAALKAIVASKVVVIMLEAATPLNAKHIVRPAKPKRSN
jgi:hypothetical protein